MASYSFGSYAYNSDAWVDAWIRQESAVPRELYSQGLGGVLLSGLGAVPRVWRARAENGVVSPSDMVAFGDAPFSAVGVAGWLSTYPAQPPAGQINFGEAFSYSYPSFYTDDQRLRFSAQRHGGRWNVGFCDGHVENLRTRNLFDFSNPDVARRWNSDHQPHNQGWHQPPPP
jgi:prepilin-type processing-associated H-X9-DG protein